MAEEVTFDELLRGPDVDERPYTPPEQVSPLSKISAFAIVAILLGVALAIVVTWVVVAFIAILHLYELIIAVLYLFATQA